MMKQFSTARDTQRDSEITWRREEGRDRGDQEEKGKSKGVRAI